MIETRFVFDDTDQRLVSIVEGDMPRPMWDGEYIASLPEMCYPSDPGAYFTSLDVKDFILMDVYMLKRDIAAGMNCPFHGEGFLR